MRLLSISLLPVLAAGLFSFAWAQPADAARGGRIGGGSFRSAPMRSAPRGGARHTSCLISRHAPR